MRTSANERGASVNSPMTAERKGKKKMQAFIGEKCTGCGGAPICIAMCPVEGALQVLRETSTSPIVRVRVNPDECIGCELCVAKGYEGALTEGCPWDAVTLVPAGSAEPASVREVVGPCDVNREHA